MKQILISIKPKWVWNIFNYKKTLEIRKTAPKEWADYLNGKTDKKQEPMIVNIYCTKGDYIGYVPKKYVGKVVAKFTLNDVYAIYNFGAIDETDTIYTEYRTGRKVDHIWVDHNPYDNPLLRDSCLLYRELNDYLKGKIGYAWRIDDLEIFDEPKELREFSVTKKYKSCDKCPHHEYDESFEHCVTCEEQVPLKRAPESWCYVEERQ